jgi:hypothetical protein
MPIGPWAASELSGPVRGASSNDLFTYGAVSITFSRSSEAAAVDPRNGWAWYDTAAPWPATDVARILADGAIFIEGASTNRILRSSAFGTAPWAGTVAGVTTGETDPTGATGACRIALTSAQEIDQTYAGDVAATRTTSIYLRQGPGSGAYKVYSIRVPTPNGHVISGTAAAAWTRFTTSSGTASGATPSDVSRIYFDARGTTGQGFGPVASAIDVDAFNAQAEDGTLATSPIRTVGAAATRAIDVCSLAAAAVPSAIKAGRWSIDIWPTWATANAPSTAYIYYLDASNYLAVVSGATLRCRANGANFDVGSLTFTAHAKRTITVDFAADTLAIDGASAVALTNDWTGSSAALSIGSDGAANAFFGVLSRARA